MLSTEPAAPPASSQGYSVHASSFSELEGGLAPRQRPCALGLATHWPAFAKPGPGFLCNLGLTPVPEAAGTKTRDGIKGRLLGTALLFLGVSATQGLQRQPLWEGQPVTVIASHCHPSPSTRTLQSTLDYAKVTLGPWLYPSLPSGRAGRNWVQVGSSFSGGACSPTLCLGHFKVKFSSMNVQPVSKEKFLW